MKKKNRIFYFLDILLIIVFALYTVLDTFVIPKTYTVIAETASTAHGTASDDGSTTQSTTESDTASSGTNAASATSSEPVITDTSYTDDNISITISEYRYNNTTIHVADVVVSSIEYLQAVFAENTYGKNVTETVSEMAESSGAILAINGDYYGARNSGYVLRNGVLYRSEASSDDQEDLVINADGSFSIILEGETSAEEIAESGALDIYSFGPALIVDGEISVGLKDEVGKAMSSNPRTAICEIEPLHYLFVVSDGRTDADEGLSLYELAQFLQTLGVKTAYNLDGGGSSTMVFNGELINTPTTSGRSEKERSVSDAIIIS